jgi:hypothetical protein
MSYGYGSSDHDHRDLEHRLEQKIEETRWDAQRDLRELEERMNDMRRELSEYIRTEVAGLSEWIGGLNESVVEVNRRVDRLGQSYPVPAKDGGRS